MKISPDEKPFEVVDRMQQMQVCPSSKSAEVWNDHKTPYNQPLFDAIDRMQRMQTIITASGAGKEAPKGKR